MDASSGFPLADVARTSYLLSMAVLPPHMPGRTGIQLARSAMHRAYLNRYFQLRPELRAEMQAWLLPVAAARLAEEIAEEREQLVGLVEKLAKYNRT